MTKAIARLMESRTEAAIMARMGRPPLKASQRRAETVRATLTAAEAEAVKAAAGRAGQTVSGWLLALIRRELK